MELSIPIKIVKQELSVFQKLSFSCEPDFSPFYSVSQCLFKNSLFSVEYPTNETDGTTFACCPWQHMEATIPQKNGLKKTDFVCILKKNRGKTRTVHSEMHSRPLDIIGYAYTGEENDSQSAFSLPLCLQEFSTVTLCNCRPFVRPFFLNRGVLCIMCLRVVFTGSNCSFHIVNSKPY